MKFSFVLRTASFFLTICYSFCLSRAQPLPRDTYIAQVAPNTNYGSSTFVTVDKNDGGMPAHGLLKFDGLTIPADHTLTKATLSLYTNSPTGGTIRAYRMHEAWSEDTATWVNLNGGNPARASTQSFYISNPVNEFWLSFNVTADVQMWLNGTAVNQGWIFISASNNGWDWSTSESSNPPQLLLETVPTTHTTTSITTASQSFQAQDTLLWKLNPDTTYATLQDITVDNSDDGHPTQALIKFPSLVPLLPLGATVTVATLELYNNNPSNGPIVGYRMMQSWDDTSATWNSFGSDGVTTNDIEAASSPSFVIPDPESHDQWKSINVTADVTLWVSGTAVVNQGWVLINSGNDGWDFDSAETSRAPNLTVTYTSPVDQPTSSPTTSAPSQSLGEESERTTTREFSATDTIIWKLNPNTSYGTVQVITVDNSDGGQPAQCLIKFQNLLTIPSSAIISAATLEIYSNNPSPGPVRAYKMISAWNESSTWNSFGSDGIQTDDSEAFSDASFSIPNPETSSVWMSINVQTDVSQWVSGSVSNEGWVLINSDDDGWDFDSAETSRPPKLTVTYTVPGGPSPTAPTTLAPSSSPVSTACPNGPATYHPGDLTVTLGGGLASSALLASTGLNGRVLTYEGRSVLPGKPPMHSRADGAATFPDDTNPRCYYLVSNSESSSGGVGILHFDATTTPHQVIDYYKTATETSTGSRNCGGGRTPWGTWLTSEESGTGSVYEVDPNEKSLRDYCRVPIVPSQGGNYESNAFWKATDDKYHFYTTEDAASNYRLTRFVPDETRSEMLAKPRKLDRLCGATGTLSYLKMVCTSGCSSNTPSGTFSWSSSRTPENEDQPYPNAEGIDVKGSELYFVTKGQRRLYILDLVGGTWTAGRTLQSGGSTFSPDQVARITGSNSTGDLLYFAEDGSGSKDIHARGIDPTDGLYKFFTIIQGYNSTETTGLTFSPDNQYMYFSHQDNSEIWQIWRNDGCPFGNGVYLDVNYHSVITRFLRGGGVFEDGDTTQIFDLN